MTNAHPFIEYRYAAVSLTAKLKAWSELELDDKENELLSQILLELHLSMRETAGRGLLADTKEDVRLSLRDRLGAIAREWEMPVPFDDDDEEPETATPFETTTPKPR